MSSNTRLRLAIWLALLGTFGGTASAQGRPGADETSGEQAELLALVHAAVDRRVEEFESRRRRPDSRPPVGERRRRFSNGPRRVPEPRGAAFARAQALGIGSLEATRRVLRGDVAADVMAAVRGEQPSRLLWPVVGGNFGRGFGFTRRERVDLRHNGVDIGAPRGAVVRAAADGLVVYSDNTLRGFGNAVLILHKNGWTTLYAHNGRNTVQPGWHVKRGERIALVGSTGIARGPHLHFELRDRGRLRDPERLFTGKASDELAGPLVDLEPVEGGHAGDATAGEASPGAPRRRGSIEGRSSREQTAPDDSATGPARRTQEHEHEQVPLGLLALTGALRGRVPPAEERAGLGRTFRNLLWPVKGGRIVRPYSGVAHRGIDIGAQDGSGVRAAADGVVLYVGEGLDGYGKLVALLHTDGAVTLYGGNREIGVEQGQSVLRGQWIARVGSTGSGAEPHLHFEWIVQGERRDPGPSLVGGP